MMQAKKLNNINQTRITTKYSIKRPCVKPTPTDKTPTPTTPPTESDNAQRPLRGSLILKTYDPASGTTLKYKTTKAAEVTRLSLAVGRLARPMAGLPVGPDATAAGADTVMEDVAATAAVPASGAQGGGDKALQGKQKVQAGSEQAPQQQGGAANGKKKKKGKR
jgi:hypothetical protein